VTRAELIARVERLERIVAALKAMLSGRTFIEIDRAEQELKKALTAPDQ
jgi:hypothetical protein